MKLMKTVLGGGVAENLYYSTNLCIVDNKVPPCDLMKDEGSAIELSNIDQTRWNVCTKPTGIGLPLDHEDRDPPGLR